MIITESAYLEHYGVKGMKWGVRNDDEGKGRKSLRERAAARNLRINSERHKMLTARAAKTAVRLLEIDDALSSLPRNSPKRLDLNRERSFLLTQRRKDLTDAKNPPSSGLTPTQKKVLIGAGVAAVLAGTYVASKHIDAEGVLASIRRGQSSLQYGDVFKRNKELAGNLSVQDVLKNVVKPVNPNYNNTGGQMNCRRATFAYELRRRGFDVVATPSSIGYGQNESGLINALVKGDKNLLSRQSMSAFASGYAETGVRTRAAVRDARQHSAYTESVKSLANLGSALKKQPSGARGEVVFDMGAFAHSMQWEIFNGTPHIFDAQKGQHFPVTKAGLDTLVSKWGQPSVAEITRLDNIDLDLAFLSRWARNR